MIGLPPGNILQYIYLKKRLKDLRSNGLCSFIEIGCGNGNVSNIFLNMGFMGIGFDLNKSACKNNYIKNEHFISNGKYNVINENFIEFNSDEKYDIIISCMVIEHMDNDLLEQYFLKCKKTLSNKGVIISLVPAAMKYWGIEDEVAGHIKSYEFNDFENLANQFNFRINKNIGLTYPLSNILYLISNRIIKKKESDKLKLSLDERTVYTGNRNIKYKTTFPKGFNLILNPIFLYAFHLLQLIFSKNKNNLVIYSELTLKQS